MTNALSTRQEQLGGKDSLVHAWSWQAQFYLAAHRKKWKFSWSLPLMRSALLRDSRFELPRAALQCLPKSDGIL